MSNSETKPTEVKPVENRDRLLDTLRVGAILYVVGFWHLFDYLPSNLHKSAVTELLTFGVLGLFCFISGYLLANRYRNFSRKDISKFYSRRLLRIYPMYLLALIGFLIFDLIQPDLFFKSVLATNMIVLAPLPTLWFVALILTLYALTPLYLIRYSFIKTIAISIIFYILLLIPNVLNIPYIDYRFPLLLPVFTFGILASRHAQTRSYLTHPFITIAAMIGFLIAVALFDRQPDRLWWFLTVDLGIFAALPLLWLFGQWVAPAIPLRLLSFLSYSSFALYLLHRLGFRIGLMIHQPVAFWDTLLYLGGIVLPLTIILAYGFQALYDKILSRIFSNQSRG